MTVRLIEPTCEAYQFPLLISQLLPTPLATAAQGEIVYRDQVRYTYADLKARIGRLASALTTAGAEQGVTVAVMDWDSHRYLECYFAIPMMGAVLQTVNVRLSADQIRYTLEHSRAEILLVHRDFAALVESIRASLPELKVCIFIEDGQAATLPDGYLTEYESMMEEADPDFPFVEFDENAVATTFYTTGTTGLPKAVYFTHRQIVLHTLATLSHLAAQAPEGFRLGDTYMPITPMFHVHAWGIPFAATLAGLKQVYPGRYEPAMLLDLRKREGVTFSHCVPTILQMLLDEADRRGERLDDWTVVIGGAAFPRELCRHARERGMRAFAGYGMSETGPLLCLARSLAQDDATEEQQIARLCQTGLPAILVQLRIVDEDMRDVPHDGIAQGEIVVRAPWLTGAYVGSNSASEELWRGGWLHTQDIATIDPDGCVNIRDRLKDVIKTGGEWISSLLLEDLILTHPAVAEVAVIGIAHPQWGERPVACIVPRAPHEGPDPQAVHSHLQPSVDSGLITRYALPDSVRYLSALPRTSVGKIDKKALRQIWADSQEAPPR